jgi:hypothetical protein
VSLEIGLDDVDRLDHGPSGGRGRHACLDRHHHVGAHLQGQHVVDDFDFRPSVEEGDHVGLATRLYALADEQRLDLPGHRDGHHDQQHADGNGADGVEHEVAGDHRQQHRHEGDAQA